VWNKRRRRPARATSSLAQTQGEALVCQWTAQMTAAGGLWGLGLHFCAEQAGGDGSGSYTVLQTAAGLSVQKYLSDTLVSSVSLGAGWGSTANVTYNYQVLYDPETGWLQVDCGPQKCR
jgi:hypothetical protein